MVELYSTQTNEVQSRERKALRVHWIVALHLPHGFVVLLLTQTY